MIFQYLTLQYCSCTSELKDRGTHAQLRPSFSFPGVLPPSEPTLALQFQFHDRAQAHIGSICPTAAPREINKQSAKL